MSNYTDDAIVRMTTLQHHRANPTYHFAGLRPDIDGQKRYVREVIDNSFDELRDIGGGDLSIGYAVDKKRGLYQFVIWDTGRGIPLGALEDCYTKDYASGKLKKQGGIYAKSGGQQGVGSKLAPGFSTYFKSVSVRDSEGIAQLIIEKSEIARSDRFEGLKTDHHNGVLTVLEADPEIFSDMKDIAKNDRIYDVIYELVFKISVFNPKIRVTIYKLPEMFSRDFFMEEDPIKTLDMVKKILELDSRVDFYSPDMLGTKDVIHRFFGDVGVVWDSGDMVYGKDDLGFTNRFFLGSTPPKASNFAIHLVNGLEITNMESTTIEVFSDEVKKFVGEYIEDEDIKKWFLQYYRMPIYIFSYMEYEDVTFHSALKNAIFDDKFKKVYSPILNSVLRENISDEQWGDLYTNVSNDIVEGYKKFNNKAIRGSNKSMLLSLNNPSCLSDCTEKAPKEERELFLVEGQSASGVKAQKDHDRHAIFLLKGKLTNVLKILKTKSSSEAQALLEKDPIFSDLMKVIGVTPKHSNLDNCRYARITIMPDADPDGYHIGALAIAGLYVMNPLLISEGMVRMALPPLYSIDMKSGEKLFVRDKKDLIDVRIKAIYSRLFELGVQVGTIDGIKKLTDEDYRSTCWFILDAGERIETIARTFNVRPSVFEQLMHISAYLSDEHLQKESVIDIVKKHFGTDGVSYEKEGRTLVIADKEGYDSFISIAGMQSAMRSKLFPFLQKYRWKKLKFFVKKCKEEDTENGWYPAPLTYVYSLMRHIDKEFPISRYKGLGQVKSEYVYHTCMNESSRRYCQITALGDIERIYDYLGLDVRTRRLVLSRMKRS